MCGICGEIRFDNQPPRLEWINQASEKIASRGPDSFGLFLQNQVALAHRRLSIIDVTDHAQQPMTDSSLGITLVFNGCIYNYKELKTELEKKYSFFSTSDTEVIIKAYHYWGTECVKHFNGMFAFVLFDQNQKKIISVRDRLGIKPLYYIHDKQRFSFASNLPALLTDPTIDRTINSEALHYYMSFHAIVPPPLTIVNGIYKQPPGTIYSYNFNGEVEKTTYWSLNSKYNQTNSQLSSKEWQNQLYQILVKAVKRRMIADVKVGVLLSGGLDSSLIVGLLAEQGQHDLHTFSIGFENVGQIKGNEFEYSDLIAKHFNTHHHRIEISTQTLIKNLPNAIKSMSEPMVSYDNIGFYLLSQEVSQHVKVVQSGQGADEIFAGYHWYPPLMNSQNSSQDYQKVFFDYSHQELTSILQDEFINQDYSFQFVNNHFNQPGADHPINKALRLDTTVMLVDDPVKRVDNMTMAWALEARVPFLDHELVEFAATIPFDLKTNHGGKGILKELARKIIPSTVIDRPKGYFPVPELQYIQGSVFDYVNDTLSSQTSINRQLFKPEYIQTLLQNPKKYFTPLKGSKLWQIALLEIWLQENNL